MTFFFRKFNTIDRTRAAGTRTGNGLRFSTSGIAFAGRLAVFLLLAGKAQPGNATDARVFAHDSAGEYAGKRISVVIGAATGPYLDTPLAAVVLRENAGGDKTVVTRPAPVPDTAIGARNVVADGDAVTFDLEDVNGDEDGEPKAFSDPTNRGLTYTLEPEDEIATITVDGSVVTITPIWRDDDKTTRVKVTATNTLDETSVPVYFDLTVETARKPVVNADPVAQGVLASGFALKTGAAPLVVHLQNLTGAEAEEDYVPLFIDPNVGDNDALPGGLLFSMGVEDVVADHVYASLSKENDVYTSAMRLVLDPVAATLTITPTAANSATVTVSATDRENYKVSTTTTITVASCDGVDMSDPCAGVTTGTQGEELPTEVGLSQNYPNPFNPQTAIDYALPQAGDVRLVVYDMLGREVDVLIDGPQAAGRHTVRFGANHLPNGTYAYRLAAGDKTITRTMVLVK